MPSEPPNESEIFHSARQMESLEERDAFLNEACGDDIALRDRIEKLLAAFVKESQYLEQPAAGLEATLGPTSDDDRADSPAEGLADTLGSEPAVDISKAHHSVLKMLDNTLAEVPRVALRESNAQGDDPIARPNSPEIPQADSESRYRLDGEIARGGMGAIIKGRDKDLGRDLAIKVLLDSHRDRPEVIQRFVEEAQIGGQLQHPGIAPVYELGQFADQRPFFSMKLVKGETLAKLLADRDDVACERVRMIGIFEQICQTMAYVHSRSVIHRDLKPANIMVGAFGEVQVMDWGLAKVLQVGGVADEKKANDQHQGQSIIQTTRSTGSDLPGSFGSAGSETQTGSVMGTPAYMPPEQALGEIDQLDERADVFGLGAILCEILTGQPPYIGDDSNQVFQLARNGTLNGANSRLDSCGAEPELIAIAKDCLALDRGARPADAGVLADRMAGYLQSVETRLRETELMRASEAARVVEQKKRLRITLALSASVLLILACGIASTAWQAFQANQARVAEAKRAESERLRAYAAEINIAFQAINENNLARARELLYRQMPDKEKDLRGFEWRYLWQLCQGDQTATFENPSSVVDVEFSPDGRLVGLAAQQLIITDVASREEITRLPTQAVTISFSTRDNLLASAGYGMTDVKIWDTESWREIRSLPKTHYPTVFSPDGKWLVTGGEAGFRVWNTATWEAEANCPANVRDQMWQLRHSVSFSPDTKLLVTPTAWGDLLQVWQFPDLEPHSRIPDSGAITTTQFLPDGERLLVGRFPDGALSVVDIASGKISDSHDFHKGWLTVIDVAHDGKTFMTGSSDRTVVIWDATEFRPRAKLRGHLAEVWALAISPNGEQAITGSQDGTVMAWDAEARHEEKELPGLFLGFVDGGPLFYAPLSVNRTKGELKPTNSVKMLDIPNSSRVDDLPVLVASSDRKLELWNTSTLTQETSWSGVPHMNSGIVTFSPDRRLAAAIAQDGVVVWSVSDGRELIRLRTEDAVHCLAFSHDARRIASGGRSRFVTVWDIETGQPLIRLGEQNGDSISMAFSPDGSLLGVGTEQGNEVVLWEIGSGKRYATLRGHLQSVSGIAFSGDGTTLATGSHDRRLKLWNVATKQEMMTKVYEGYIANVSFSPDDSTLVVSYIGGDESRIEFLQAAKWEQINEQQSNH